MTQRTFTTETLARYLHVSTADIDRLVRSHEIPFDRRGDNVVFQRDAIDAWASQRILGFGHHDLQNFHHSSSVKAHDLSEKHAIIPELMKPEFIHPAVARKTKNSVIRDMVKLAGETELLNYPDDLLEGIQRREQLCSTALAGGIALLHTARHEPYISEDSFMVLGRTVQPIPFGSPDGRTTDLFFLLCAQDDRTHLHLLARICTMCYHTDMLISLREASDAASMYETVVNAENEVIESLPRR